MLWELAGMPNRLRFTGALPPPNLWQRYPNWTCALRQGELGEDEDESTMCPANNQKTINREVVWTVADVLFASGTIVPAFVQVLDGELNWIHVYPEAEKKNKAWVLWFAGPKNRCVALSKDSLSRGANLSVPVGDLDVFPLRITTRLRYKRKQIVVDVAKVYTKYS